MNRRLPKVGDIWRDDHGMFLVTKEYELNDWDARNGYVCQIDVLDLGTGVLQDIWTISESMLRDLIFIA